MTTEETTTTETTETTTTSPRKSLGVMTKNLPCALTSEERNAKGSELTRQMFALEDLNEKKKEAVASYKRRIDAMTLSISALRDVVSSGMEDRPVACDKVPNYSRSVWEFVRQDTGGVAEWIPMSTSERQLAIPGAGPLPEEAPAKSKKKSKKACEVCGIVGGDHDQAVHKLAEDDAKADAEKGARDAWDDEAPTNDDAMRIADEQERTGEKPEGTMAPLVRAATSKRGAKKAAK